MSDPDEKAQIAKQLKFVAWLKERGLYNAYESAATMRKMHAVWEAAQPDSPLVDLIPSNWADPALTGPDATLHGEPGTWDCQDIERLLSALKKRIADAAAEAPQ